jgi:hypothetical protein
MKRPAVALVVVALAALIGAGIWFALRGEPDDDGTIVETEAPTVEAMTGIEQRDSGHRNPYPFDAFGAEIAQLKMPGTEGDYKSLDDVQVELWEKIGTGKLTLRLERPTFRQIVDEANRQIAPQTGVKIYYYEEAAFPDDFPWDDIVINEGSIHDLLQMLLHRTSNECKHYLTGNGLVIGKEGAVQQAQLDWRAQTAQARSDADAKADLLKKEYRPDFDRATIAAVIRQVYDQTGVEVVTDPETWSKQRVVTWRSKPTTLGAALQRICKDFGAYYRVKDGRVFLLQP